MSYEDDFEYYTWVLTCDKNQILLLKFRKRLCAASTYYNIVWYIIVIVGRDFLRQNEESNRRDVVVVHVCVGIKGERCTHFCLYLIFFDGG